MPTSLSFPRVRLIIGLLAAIAVIPACTDVLTSPDRPAFVAQQRSRTEFTVQEDVLNPCNGEIIHLTTEFRFATTFFSSGRELDHFIAHGTGVSDQGTRYTTHTVARASAIPYEQENNVGHEHVIGSAPGSSFTDVLRVFDFTDGAGKPHELFRSEMHCH